MDVKHTILNSVNKEDIYVEYPISFENFNFINQVYKLK